MVVGLLRPGAADLMERFISMREVAEIGLIAVAASFLPVAIHAYGWSEETTWRAGSVLFYLAWFSGAVVGIWRRSSQGINPGELLRRQPVSLLLTVGMNVVGGLALLYNAFVPGPNSGARYVTAVLLILGISGLMFVQAAFAKPAGPPAA